jgi:hypothetical protein
LDGVVLDLSRVVGLNRLLEIGVQGLDLGEDLLGLGLFRSNGGCRTRTGREETGGRESAEKREGKRVSPSRSDQNRLIGTAASKG